MSNEIEQQLACSVETLLGASDAGAWWGTFTNPDSLIQNVIIIARGDCPLKGLIESLIDKLNSGEIDLNNLPGGNS